MEYKLTDFFVPVSEGRKNRQFNDMSPADSQNHTSRSSFSLWYNSSDDHHLQRRQAKQEAG